MPKLPKNCQPATSAKRNAGALASLRPLLSGWRPEYPPPEGVDLISAALAEAEANLEAMEVKALTVAVERTLALWTVPDNWDNVAGFYLEALEDVPADLVEVALKSLRQRRRWNNFPKPADLRVPIVDLLNARRVELNTIKTMLASAARERSAPQYRRPPTEAEKARVSDIVASIAKTLRAS